VWWVQLWGNFGAAWAGFGATSVQLGCNFKSVVCPCFPDERGGLGAAAVQLAPKSFFIRAAVPCGRRKQMGSSVGRAGKAESSPSPLPLPLGEGALLTGGALQSRRAEGHRLERCGRYRTALRRGGAALRAGGGHWEQRRN
jgi:hypothetical protein